MKTKQMKTFALIALFAIILSGNTWAQRGQGRRNGNGNGQFQPRFENRGEFRNHRIPNLTEEQEKKLDVLRTRHLKAVQNYKSNLDILRAELRALEINAKADMNAINGKIDELNALQGKLQKQNAKYRQDVRALLDDEQRIYFDSRTNKRRFGNRQGRGNRSGAQFMRRGPQNGTGPRAQSGDCLQTK